jgi:uncharacterized protein (DUF4415 family)
MSKPTKKRKAKFILEVTEAEYRRKLAKGLDPETVLEPGRHEFQRSTHVIRPDETVMVNGKVRVMMYLDADVVEFFQSSGGSYQTEINAALRSLMTRSQPKEDVTAKRPKRRKLAA